MMKLPSKTIKPVEEQEDEDPYEKIEIKKVDYIFTKVEKLAVVEIFLSDMSGVCLALNTTMNCLLDISHVICASSPSRDENCETILVKCSKLLRTA